MLLLSIVILLLPEAGAVPSEVTGVMMSVVPGQVAIKVDWDKPSSDLPIIRYEVEYGERGVRWIATVTVQGADSLTTTITNLQRGTTYVVRVRAVSGQGAGDYTLPIDRPSLILPNLPSQVIGVSLSVVSGQAAIRVNWNKPSVERTFIRYDVHCGVSGLSFSYFVTVPGADSLTTVISGLRRGISYVVRVRAVSNVGNGPYSQTPDPIITVPNVPATVSGVNVIVVENQGSITITVTWRRPSQSDVPIAHYEVNYTYNESAPILLNTTALTATINGMSGEFYKVRVRAVSAEGTGGWSPYTTIAPASVPTGVAATSIGTSSVTITWNNDGFKYRILAQREGSRERPSQDPVSPPHTITGLDSNTGYTITVEAYSPLGQAGRNISISTLPEASSSLNLEVVSSTVIRVTWAAPPNADRLPLTYLISYQSEFDKHMKETSTQPVELTGLHIFAEYTVRVQARNTGGQSVTVTSKSTTLSAAPSLPPQSVRTVDGLKTHDSLTWAWQLPSRAGRNGIITSYFITFTRLSGREQPVGNFTKVVDNPSFDAPSDLTYTLTSLSANTLYSIRIAAVTSSGTGVFSTVEGRKTNFNLYVSLLTIQVDSDTSATISWAAPEGVDSSVSSYKVYFGVYQSGTFVVKATSDSTKSVQQSMPPEFPIEVSVIPETRQGPGGSVSRIFFTKEGVPTVPVKDVTVMRINSVSLRVSWTPLSLHEARGWPLYTVIVESTAGRTTRATNITRNTNDSTVDVGGLDPSTSYSVRVQVGTSAGTSAATTSDSVEFQASTVDPTSPIDSQVGVNIGVFVAGLVAGVLGLLLVGGIVFGACKLNNQPIENGPKESGSDPNTIEMVQCPAYESVDKDYI